MVSEKPVAQCLGKTWTQQVKVSQTILVRIYHTIRRHLSVARNPEARLCEILRCKFRLLDPNDPLNILINKLIIYSVLKICILSSSYAKMNT
jgi:hypothetical protein